MRLDQTERVGPPRATSVLPEIPPETLAEWSTVFTAAVPMTNAAGPGPRHQQRSSAAAAARGWPGACSAPGPIGDGDSSLTAYALVPRPVHRGIPCRRTIEWHMGRIPESIWGTAPYCSGRGGGLSRGPGTARPGPTGRAVAAGAAHVRRWDGRPRGTLVPGFAALSPVGEPGEEHPEVVLRAFADQECIARQAAGLVNQGRGGRPVNIVEHGFVQRCQDALECVVAAHGDVFLQS